MRRFVDIPYRTARLLVGVPTDTLGAMVLFALEHPGLIAVLVAVVFSILKFVVVAILGSIVTWYVTKMFAIHVWPKLPDNRRQMLRRLVNRALMRPPGQDQGNSRKSESAFSRNSKRHQHW